MLKVDVKRDLFLFAPERNVMGRIAKGMQWNWLFACMWYCIESCNGAQKGEGRKKSGIKNWPEKLSDLLLVWMENQSWCRAVAHTKVRGDGKWTWGISAWIQAVGFLWVGEGAWVPPWEWLVKQYWKKLWETPPHLQSGRYPSRRTFSDITKLVQIHAPGRLRSASCSSGADDQDIGESAVENAGPMVHPEPSTCQDIGKTDVSPLGLSLFHWSCRWK